MLDHVGVEVTDFARSKAFYEAALAPLGIRLLMEFEGVGAGFGSETEHGPKPYFWIGERGRPAVSGAHVAFARPHTEDGRCLPRRPRIAAGGTDNGAPGPRPIYHPGYYGAFVLDPDGNNVEAVCHRAAG